MFGKVKKWLGIEGVKIELDIPDEVDIDKGVIGGKIRFFSKNTQLVTGLSVKLVERYSRGRRSEKLTDEYKLGEIKESLNIEVPADDPIEIDFNLPFEMMKSEMDKMQARNFLLGGVVKTAKWLQGVKSEYRVEAKAKVEGTALDPFDKKIIKLK